MAVYKRFEMKLMMNQPNVTQNSMDFLLMPPPNMQFNTPFVMADERMGRASQSNATPFLLNRVSGGRNIDDPLNWNFDTAKTNAPAKNIVSRTNGLPGTKTNTPSLNVTSNKRSKIENDCDSSLNGTDDAANTNGSGGGINSILGGQQNLLNNVNNTSIVNQNASNDKNGSSDTANSQFDAGPKNGDTSTVFSRFNFNGNHTDRNDVMDSESKKQTDKQIGIHLHDDQSNVMAGSCQKKFKSALPATTSAKLFETSPFSIGDYINKPRVGDSNEQSNVQPNSGKTR